MRQSTFRNWKHHVCAFCLLMLGLINASIQPAIACTFPPDQYSVSHKELVSNSERIVLAKLLDVRLENKRSWRYRFTTLETLKGPERSTFELEGSSWNPLPFLFPLTDEDFDNHQKPEFWLHGVGRVYNSPDCLLHPTFKLRKTYLLFLGFDHSQGFERINNPDDRWLLATRALVENPSLPAGRSLSWQEYLSNKQTLALAEWDDCEAAYLRNEPNYRIVEIFFGTIASDLPNKPSFPFRFYNEPRHSGIDCQPGKRFLITGIRGKGRWKMAEAMPLLNGRLDLRNRASNIHIPGSLLIPIDEIRTHFTQ